MAQFVETLAWHHLTFLFALVAIFVFRHPIADLIKRTTRIDKEGLKAELSPEAQREMTETSSEAVQQLLDAVGNSVVIREQEDAIRRDLVARGFSTEGGSVLVLTRHLAGTQILLAFERVHGSIFGSQIFLLKKLNEVTGQGRSSAFVYEHIDHVKKLYSAQLGDWSYEQYLGFIFAQLLIVRDGDQFHITNFGVEYLTWMARNGRSESRPL